MRRRRRPSRLFTLDFLQSVAAITFPLRILFSSMCLNWVFNLVCIMTVAPPRTEPVWRSSSLCPSPSFTLLCFLWLSPWQPLDQSDEWDSKVINSCLSELIYRNYSKRVEWVRTCKSLPTFLPLRFSCFCKSVNQPEGKRSNRRFTINLYELHKSCVLLLTVVCSVLCSRSMKKKKTTAQACH